jgi:DNA invertase Pin-like site-specific DNA recombinase
MRVALYARCSTKKDQDPDLQLDALRRHVQLRGFTVVGEYVDRGISGATPKRPELDRLVQDAWAGKFQVILVWKFDRFARSLPHLLQGLEQFHRLGIEFVSLTEQFDTTTPIGKAMLAVVGAMAQLERDLIRERVLAGLERAKAKGTRLGRKPREVDGARVVALHRAGQSWRRIARTLKVSHSTVYRHAQEALRNGFPTATATGG